MPGRAIASRGGTSRQTLARAKHSRGRRPAIRDEHGPHKTGRVGWNTGENAADTVRNRHHSTVDACLWDISQCQVCRESGE